MRIALALALALCGAACPRRGTGLRVEVDGPLTPPFDALDRLDVTVTPSQDYETVPLAVTASGGAAFALPTSLVLALASPTPGQALVCVTAIAGGGAAGSGCGSGTVEIGRTNVVLVTVSPPKKCGNGTWDVGEDCDGADLGGATCVSEGLGGGALACTAACAFDVSGCDACGNGTVDAAAEECDGVDLDGWQCDTLMMGFVGGTLACTSACAFDTTGCIPECEFDSDCDDGNPCTSESCFQNECLNPTWPNGTSCDDGLWCTGVDECMTGACTSTGDPCGGTCDEAADWCTCDDGNACSGPDHLDAPGGSCTGSPLTGAFCGPCDAGGCSICCGGSCVDGTNTSYCAGCTPCTSPPESCTFSATSACGWQWCCT